MINKNMRNDSELIFERYLQSKNPFILEGGIKDLYQYDLNCIDSIIEEGMLGDTLSKVGSGFKSAAGSVGSFFKDKLLKGIFDLIVSRLSEEEKGKLSGELKKLEDPNFLQQKAKEGQNLLQQQNESYISNEQFLVEFLFTENNLIQYLENQILLEAKKTSKPSSGKAKRGKPMKLKPTFTGTKDIVDQAVKALQKKYKTQSSMMRAYKTFNAQLLKKLGIDPNITAQPQKTQASVKTQSPKSSLTSGLPPMGGRGLEKAGGRGLASIEDTGEPVTRVKREPKLRPPFGPTIEVEPDSTGTFKPVGKEGFFKKAFNWVKANPNLTAAGVLALVAALTVATGGTVLPIAAKALMGGGITGGIEAAKQKINSGSVDWKKIGSAALKGAAGGAALGGLGKLAGGAASAGLDIVDTGDTLDKYTQDQDFLDPDMETEPDTTPETDTTPEAPEDFVVSDDEFQEYNKSDFDVNSLEDRTKLRAMELLKNKHGGNIPASEYNDIASKISNLVRSGKKMSTQDILTKIDPGLIGESYTSGYLNYF
jgi:hypothetical protein